MFLNGEEYNAERLLYIKLNAPKSNLKKLIEESALTSVDESYSVEKEEESIANKRKAKCRKTRPIDRKSSTTLIKTKRLQKNKSKPKLLYAQESDCDSRRRMVKLSGSEKLTKCLFEARRENQGKIPVSSAVMPRRKTRVPEKSRSSLLTSIPPRSHQRNVVGAHDVSQRETNQTRKKFEFAKQRSRSSLSDLTTKKSSGRQSPSSQSARSSQPSNISSALLSPGPSTSVSDEIQPISSLHRSRKYRKSSLGSTGKPLLEPRSRNHDFIDDHVITIAGEETSRRVQSKLFSDQSPLNAKKISKTLSNQEIQQKNTELYEDMVSSATNHLLTSSSSMKPKHMNSLIHRSFVTRSGRTITKEAGSAVISGIKPGIYKKQLILEPVIPSATINPDQNEVISRWRKRLRTSSSNSTSAPKFSSPLLASPSLRDSQILRVNNADTSQNSSRKEFNASNSTTTKLSEKDFPEVYLDEKELQTLLGQRRRQQSPSDVLSPSEEEALIQDLKIEKIKKQIRWLEEIAQTKLDQLETIRWKKKKALEEQLLLNEKLEKILFKIQELRGSESFARFIDKQTQVFAKKRPKSDPNDK